MKNTVFALAAVAVALTLSACGEGPKVASKANFVKAITAEPNCYGLWNIDEAESVQAGYGEPAPFIKAMLDGGMLEKRTERVPMGFVSMQQEVYGLTFEGKAWWDKHGKAAFDPATKKICAGERAPVEVTEYTEPSASHESRVKYRWTVKDAPSWLTSGPFSGLPGIANPADGVTAVHLTGDGWKEMDGARAAATMFGIR